MRYLQGLLVMLLVGCGLGEPSLLEKEAISRAEQREKLEKELGFIRIQLNEAKQSRGQHTLYVGVKGVLAAECKAAITLFLNSFEYDYVPFHESARYAIEVETKMPDGKLTYDITIHENLEDKFLLTKTLEVAKDPLDLGLKVAETVSKTLPPGVAFPNAKIKAVEELIEAKEKVILDLKLGR